MNAAEVAICEAFIALVSQVEAYGEEHNIDVSDVTVMVAGAHDDFHELAAVPDESEKR